MIELIRLRELETELQTILLDLMSKRFVGMKNTPAQRNEMKRAMPDIIAEALNLLHERCVNAGDREGAEIVMSLFAAQFPEETKAAAEFYDNETSKGPLH